MALGQRLHMTVVIDPDIELELRGEQLPQWDIRPLRQMWREVHDPA